MNVRDDLAEDTCGVLYPEGDAMRSSENKSEEKFPWPVDYKCGCSQETREERVDTALPHNRLCVNFCHPPFCLTQG